MTRKHFEAAAAIIAQVPARGASPEWIANQFADMFAAENPRFDRDRFVEACGVGVE